jgi:hypothetical protein
MANTTMHYPGKVRYPTATDGPFAGIIWGVPVTVTITYDQAKVPSNGYYQYKTFLGSNGGITFAAGDLTFGPHMDNGKSPGWPIIQFKDGLFNGISYSRTFAQGGADYVFSFNGLFWEITAAANRQVKASGAILPTPSSGEMVL